LKAIPCIICGHNDWTQWIVPKRKDIPAAELYGAAAGVSGTQSLIKCESCSFIIEFPRLPDAEIISGYISAGNSGHDSQYVQRVKSFEKTLKRIGSLVPKAPARVLDIGCAGGAFVEASGNLGYQSEGVEPAADLVDSAIRRGLSVRRGTAETLSEVLTEKYDLVSLWDVIEHVLDPEATLDSAIKLLNVDGVLVVNIPDIGTPLARFVGKRNWWISSVHIYHFSAKHITRLLENRGLKIVGKKMFFQTLTLGYLLEIAVQMRVPLSRIVSKISPESWKTLPIPYYASQTTIIARRVGL
jgi:2-polyprenyl-3-methyl-5-hydroxy-6-metoxy-1,4-benzoquinol methylase